MKTETIIARMLLAALPIGFTGIWQTQRKIDRDRAAISQEQDELMLSSGKLIKRLSLEYAPLAAELYWTRAVQYYGDKRAHKDPNFDLLWPLLDITTTLDPQLLVAYRFGSMFLSEEPAVGAGRSDLAIELVKRGIRENPEYWRLYEDLGFIYYIHLKDYPKASAAFLEGSKVPGAFDFMKVLAALVAQKGESRETAAFLWNEIYRSTKDISIRQNALTHLQLIQAEIDCEKLDVLAAEYEKRTGHRPDSVRELINAGMLSGAPTDPFGVIYVFGGDGKAQINPSSPLMGLKNRYVTPFFLPEHKPR